MHNTFIHRRDNTISINGIEISLEVLKTYDPSYSLPTGMKSLRYTHDPKTGDGYHFQHDGFRNIKAPHPDSRIEHYISNVENLRIIQSSVNEEAEAIDSLISEVSLDYAQKRKAEYPPIEDLVVAMWEIFVEGNESNMQRIKELQIQRLHIREKYPKS